MIFIKFASFLLAVIFMCVIWTVQYKSSCIIALANTDYLFITEYHIH